jgi:zinc protease
LGDVLNSQRGALYALVPEGKALDTGFSLSPLPQTGVGYVVGAFPQGGSGEELVKEMQQVLTDDLKYGIPGDLVEAAKRHEVADEEFQKNSIEGLAMEWSTAVAIEGRQSPRDDVDAIQRVSVDDVNRVAKKCLDPTKAIIALLTPQSSGKPVSSKTFGGAESLAGSPSGPVTLPAWAVHALASLAVPPLTTYPISTTLSNGLRLIVQPEAINRTVTVVGHVKNNSDLETPPAEEGVARVLDGLFSYGTETLDRIAFQKALDDIAANESAGADFSLAVLADHFDRGVSLLADNLLHPALPESAFKVVQQETSRALAGQLKTPDYLAQRALDASLFPKDDPSPRQATPSTVSALSLQNVKQYHERVFRPDLTTIVVIGDVTLPQAQQIIEKYFGEWKASGTAPVTELSPVPANQPGFTIVPDKSRVQVKVLLAETLGLNRFDPHYYALELGNHVLGGGFYGTRLYRDLRQNSGLVYFVSSSFDVGKTRAIYAVDYACDPQNVSKARAVVLRDLKAMQTAPVSADDLRQAKAMLLRQVPLSEASIDQIAAGWISRSTIGLPLDEPNIAARHYVELSADPGESRIRKMASP